jgi:uncharacterized protein YjiS (DUF1127 family)
MPDIHLSPPRATAAFARLKQRLAATVAFVDLALQVRRERRALLELSEHALKDLGLNGDAHAEAHRRFWDVPVERLCR